MSEIRAFVDIHPLIAVVVCGVCYLALLLLARPLPEELKGDGLPMDWPRKSYRYGIPEDEERRS